MKTISYSFLFFALFLFAACQNEQAKPNTAQEAPAAETAKRIVSLNGSLTELLYQLDLGQNVVGVDVTSSYPEAAQALPKLGHVNKLNVEAVLALNPNYILADSNALASPAIQQLAQSAEIEVVAVPVPQRLDGAVASAKALAQKLPIAPEKIEALEEEIKKDQNALREFLAQQKASPKVLFIYARGSKIIMAAGPNTPMAKMIKLAGGQNAVDDFEDFKPLTPESVLASQPDVLLLFNSGLASLAQAEKSADEALLSLPALVQTPAAKHKRIISMEGHYLSGFGPRAAKAALELAQNLESEMNK